jgi:endoglucanase
MAAIIPKIGTPQIKLLEKLCAAAAISGQEGEVRQIVKDELEKHADELRVDALGNVLVTKKGGGRGRTRVMLAAHMDEVGFMITGDDKDGIYKFDTVGSLDVRQLVGKTVIIGKDRVSGVIGFKPIHLTTASERSSAPSLDGLRMDTGGGANGKVKVGDRAAFAPGFAVLGSGGTRTIRAKALDDRVGVATLIELVRRAPANVELLAAFTTQEEIGVRGAKVAAHAFDPDLAIVLDCSPAYDLPHWDGEENTRYNTRLGFGPAIYIADSGTLSDPRLVRHFTETAEAGGIPYQFRQGGGGGTDAGGIHKARAGIPSLSISVPGRYLHTAASLIRLSDWQDTLRLVHTAISTFKPGLLKAERK